MSHDDGYALWPFGLRLQSDVNPGFTQELQEITVGADAAIQPDGSPAPGAVDRTLLRQELVALMKRAHRGTVREIEYEVVREGDRVVELKYPRPGNLQGWHYRLYVGAPDGRFADWLVWLVASRKPDSTLSKIWDLIQNEHVTAAVARLKVWIVARMADRSGC
ncbi:hypothetical protein [Nocardia sp. XZ_19_385]|uniref:hypothetical protein n=1 Tax=Nocardia sp. XZ_19_385 TaxID=2769488 RepID=UPI0018901BB4|nr:hypothetical protein [Nocardia sp. XZ_19_385]